MAPNFVPRDSPLLNPQKSPNISTAYSQQDLNDSTETLKAFVDLSPSNSSRHEPSVARLSTDSRSASSPPPRVLVQSESSDTLSNLTIAAQVSPPEEDSAILSYPAAPERRPSAPIFIPSSRSNDKAVTTPLSAREHQNNYFHLFDPTYRPKDPEYTPEKQKPTHILIASGATTSSAPPSSKAKQPAENSRMIRKGAPQFVNLYTTNPAVTSPLGPLSPGSIQKATMSSSTAIQPPRSRAGAPKPMRLQGLPKFHPANYQNVSASSSQNTSSSSTPQSMGANVGMTPVPSNRGYSDAQRALHLYQREVISRSQSGTITSSKPISPRLDPLGSPGPVTPLMLEEQGGYMIAGMRQGGVGSPGGIQEQEIIERLIRSQGRGGLEPGFQAAPVRSR
jgi:hypothetical protein